MIVPDVNLLLYAEIAAFDQHAAAEPLAVDDAIDRVTRWLDQPNVSFLVPGSRWLD